MHSFRESVRGANWIIMPYLDAPDYTQPAVGDCIQQAIPGGVRLLLIDNGSQDMEIGINAARHYDPVILWRHNPPLPSLAATWNHALQFVWDVGGEYALVVNNDVRLHPQTYRLLREVQALSGAWFVSACNVGEAVWQELMENPKPIAFPRQDSKGGPDFSCFLITKDCHQWFQFDEHFRPAYHEDNDYHRRLQLAGLGDKIFGVPVPYLHYGSGTLRSNEALAKGWPAKFEACRQYYIRKWGGLPGAETHIMPFSAGDTDAVIQAGLSVTQLYTGQGKAGTTREGPYPWGSDSTSSISATATDHPSATT